MKHMDATSQIPEAFKKTIEYAKNLKESYIDWSDSGDMSPTVIVETAGEILAIVAASKPDKEEGLNIAAFSKIGFNPDYLTLIVDTRSTKIDSKETLDSIRKKFPVDSLKKMCEEEQAREKGIVKESVLCIRTGRDGKSILATLSYSYFGPDSVLSWNEVSFFDQDAKLEGNIPNALNLIMTNTETIFEKFPKLKELTSENFQNERSRFHMSRAVLSIFHGFGCRIIDYISPKHLDWFNFKQSATSFVNKTVANNGLPHEALSTLSNLVENYDGKIPLHELFSSIFEAHQYWLPDSFRYAYVEFSVMYASYCYYHSTLNDVEIPNTPNRVKVWNGDKSSCLGEATYLGEAVVYCIRNDNDDTIASAPNPEIEPSYVPYGSELIKLVNNPKFKLDSGEIVYGCQIWWEDIE